MNAKSLSARTAVNQENSYPIHDRLSFMWLILSFGILLFSNYTAGDRTVVARVPIRGVRTLYAQLGDFFPWSCIAGLGLLLVLALVRGRVRHPRPAWVVEQPGR